jgi:hypothetical protein
MRDDPMKTFERIFSRDYSSAAVMIRYNFVRYTSLVVLGLLLAAADAQGAQQVKQLRRRPSRRVKPNRPCSRCSNPRRSNS